MLRPRERACVQSKDTRSAFASAPRLSRDPFHCSVKSSPCRGKVRVVEQVHAEAREQLAPVETRPRRQVRVVRITDQEVAITLPDDDAPAQLAPAAEFPADVELDLAVADAIGREAMPSSKISKFCRSLSRLGTTNQFEV